MLENLNPAKKVDAPNDFRPALEFDGNEGVATLPAVPMGQAPDFDQFLIDQGFSPSEYEIVGSPRTSRWQKYDGDWLTSYRFNFRRTSQLGDLKLLWSKAKPVKKSKVQPKLDTALVVMLSDYQLGKGDHRGGAEEQLGRILSAYDDLEERFRKGKYEQIIFAEMGDIVEGFSNKADLQQLATNTMSIMDQVDLATTLTYEIIKRASKYSKVTYATVASNHCQNRINKQAVGLPGNDDWGIFIAKQLHRLTKEVGLELKILIPQPSDETLAVDVFDDQFHVLGLWHGHQSSRPDAVPIYWQKAAFNNEPIAGATIGLTGHFHHSRLQELGLSSNGGSRYWIMGKTMDNGSSWFKLNGGSESQPGITCFELQKGKHFTGTIFNV